MNNKDGTYFFMLFFDNFLEQNGLFSKDSPNMGDILNSKNAKLSKIDVTETPLGFSTKDIDGIGEEDIGNFQDLNATYSPATATYDDDDEEKKNNQPRTAVAPGGFYEVFISCCLSYSPEC